MSGERVRIQALNPKLENNPFISSPGDYLAHNVAEQIALVPQFAKIFGSGKGRNIDGYLRGDYGVSNLPALRIYQMESYTMTADNWFIDGQLELDVILPPSLRREDLHFVSDVLTGALVSQFRRLPFFQAMRAAVPALNYLGQSITVSKNRAFMMNENDQIPMAVVTSNFRIDLREWDLYLESNDRTVDDPFDVTLADLDLIAALIAPQNDDGTNAGVDLPSTQTV